MTDTETWREQFLCQPEPDPLYELAREYVRRTEAFDRAICSAWHRKDAAAMPMTPSELARCNVNAEAVRRELRSRPGVDGADLVRAIRRYDQHPRWGDYREWGFDQPMPGAHIIED